MIAFWIRMTMGIGVMTLPYYVKQLGILAGGIAIIIGGFLTLIAFKQILEASEYTQQIEYYKIIEKLLSPKILGMFRVAHLFELLLIFTVYCITAWDLFKYFLFCIGAYKTEWIIDAKILEWNEYNPQVFQIRILYFLSLFFLLLPLMFKKDLSSLKLISFLFLATMITLLTVLTFEAPFFRKHLQSEQDYRVEYTFKKVTPEWIVTFFSITMSYYVQPFALGLKKELYNPTLYRIKKVAYTSCFLLMALFIIFGLLCYYSFGDLKTPKLQMLRVPYEAKPKLTEILVKLLVILFMFCNNVGLSNFNPIIRTYINSMVTMQNEKLLFILSSIFTFVFGFSIGIIMPNITTVFWILGLVICNFNGYIIPCLMNIKTGGNKVLNYILISFYFICMGIGCYYNLYATFNNNQFIMGNQINNGDKQNFKTQYYTSKERNELKRKFWENDQRQFAERDLKDIDYQPEELGEGSFAKVFCVECYDIMNGPISAVVKIFKNKNNDSEVNKQILQEQKILKKLFHKNIIRLYCRKQLKYDNNQNVLIFENCRFNLAAAMNILKTQSDSQIKLRIILGVFQQILKGLEYIHYKGIIHGDLKLENILVSHNNIIKIADFGQSKFYQNLYKGTEDLKPPEYKWHPSFQLSADIWQFGIIAYQFFGGSINDVKKAKIRYLEDFNSSQFFQRIFSNKIKDKIQMDFLRQCLNPIPELRQNASCLLKHEIFDLVNISLHDQLQSSILFMRELKITSSSSVILMGNKPEIKIQNYQLNQICINHHVQDQPLIYNNNIRATQSQNNLGQMYTKDITIQQLLNIQSQEHHRIPDIKQDKKRKVCYPKYEKSKTDTHMNFNKNRNPFKQLYQLIQIKRITNEFIQHLNKINQRICVLLQETHHLLSSIQTLIFQEIPFLRQTIPVHLYLLFYKNLYLII